MNLEITLDEYNETKKSNINIRRNFYTSLYYFIVETNRYGINYNQLTRVLTSASRRNNFQNKVIHIIYKL